MPSVSGIRPLRAVRLLGIVALALAVCPFAAAQVVDKGGEKAVEKPADPAPAAAPVQESGTINVALQETFLLGPLNNLDPIKRPPIVIRDKLVSLAEPGPIPRGAITVKMRAQRLGKTEVILIGEQGNQKTYVVQVLPSVEFTNLTIRKNFPKARVTVSSAGDGLLLLEGSVDTPAEALEIRTFVESVTPRTGRLIDATSVVGVQQVQLEVCIAQVNRTRARQLAANLLYSDRNGFAGQSTGSVFPTNPVGIPAMGAAGPALLPAVAAGPGILNPGQLFNSNSNVFAGLTTPRFNIFAALQALKNEGVAKILASPTLVTLNGKPADFLVGGEQPIPQVISTGNGASSGLIYKPFGLRLTFVPVLVGNGRIRIDVVPELSRPVPTGDIFQGVRVVSFDTQRLRATVEMEDGQTLALGGLLRQEEDAQVTKIPILGDIPWLGALFRRTAAAKIETELIILVTPRLAEPLRGCQAPSVLPGQETRSPNDAELFLKGMIEMPSMPGLPTEPAPSPLPPGFEPVPEPAAPAEKPKDEKGKGELGKPREDDSPKTLPPIGTMTTRGVPADEAPEPSGFWSIYTLGAALCPASEDPVAGAPDWLGAIAPG